MTDYSVCSRHSMYTNECLNVSKPRNSSVIYLTNVNLISGIHVVSIGWTVLSWFDTGTVKKILKYVVPVDVCCTFPNQLGMSVSRKTTKLKINFDIIKGALHNYLYKSDHVKNYTTMLIFLFVLSIVWQKIVIRNTLRSTQDGHYWSLIPSLR